MSHSVIRLFGYSVIRGNRQGSALLIVLGMLSFMVVSAVGFAAYMRYSRLPSSFLRRSASSRQLVKAALAEAINEIDSMIGEDPYPDIRLNATKQKGPAKGSENRNTWAGNVYIGTHAAPGTGSGGYSYPSSESTVSTLTLEGLAYIPPSLVNEARYYSRHSAAGKWHDMAYDVGRYAFCAIDVSDCFDINALKADLARNSGENRVSLAYLFEDVPDHKNAGSADTWDKFIDKCYAQKMPLVSLADWNLAIANGDKSGGNVAGISAPFVKWLKSNGQGFLEVNDIEKVRLMPFITDGWFPSADSSSSLSVDIGKEDEQPFSSYSDNVSLKSMIDGSACTAKWKQLLQGGSAGGARALSGLDMAALYDYLDDNEVPVSLAIPTVERAPMICGFQFNNQDIELKVTKQQTNPGAELQPNSTAPTKWEEKWEYKFDAAGFCKFFKGNMKGLALFPFRRGKERSRNFTVDACIRLFFAPDGMKYRYGTSVIHPTKNDFKSGATRYQDGVFNVYCTGNMSVPNEVLDEEQAVVDITFNMNDGNNLASALGTPVFTFTHTYGVVKVPGSDPPQWTKDTSKPPEVTDVVQNFTTIDGSFSSVAGPLPDSAFLPGATDGPNVTLYAACWFRVLEDGKVVDLAPAAMCDDIGIADRVGSGLNDSKEAALFGAATPLLRLVGTPATGPTFHWGYDLDALNGVTVSFNNKQMMCPDPRYNHAPEDWMTFTGGFNANGWLAECGAGKAGRDHDIFMFESGQEWLQSPYELAFLPRVSNLVGDGNSVYGYCDVPDLNRGPAYAAAMGDCQHQNLMWRTYRCYGYNAQGDGNLIADNFDNLKIRNSRGGFRITPYTQQTNVMMAAFANTPYDWWAASPYNEDIGLSGGGGTKGKEDSEGTMTALKFNRSYAFNAIGGGSDRHIAWKDLEKISAEFMQRLRANRNDDWRDVYEQDLDWHGNGTDEDNFCNVQLTDSDYLSECDRKFLYGYWRECFANRQQLFLIFVRAEPALMGAGTAGAIPPALGGRAVALVWRNPVAGKIVADGEDPVEPSDEYAPHRTRILFYRQLD